MANNIKQNNPQKRNASKADKKINKSMPAKKKEYLLIAAIIFAGLLLRLLFVFEINKVPFLNYLASDSKIYNDWAKQISGGNWTGDSVFFMGPLYPYFMGIFYFIFGVSLSLIRVVQVILSTLTIYIIFLTSKNLFSKTEAYLSAGIAAIYSGYIFYSGIILSETLQVFLISCLLWQIVLVMKDEQNLRWLWIGLLFGLLSLIRANILMIAIFILIWLIIRLLKKEQNKIYYKNAVLLLIAGICIVILPVTLHNYAIGKDFVLITSNGGINFYLGNNPRSQGVFSAPEEFDFFNDLSGQKYAEKISNKNLKPSEASSFWTQKGFDFIKENPAIAGKLYLNKLFLFLGPEENSQSFTMDYEFYKKSYSNILKIPLPSFFLILCLSVLGIFYLIRERKPILLIYLILIGYIISSIIFFVNGRFRLALTPLLIIFSGYALYKIYLSLSLKKYKEFLLPVIIIAAFIFINHSLVQKPVYNGYDSFIHLGNYYQETGDYSKAINSYQKSLQLKDNSLTYMNLGNAYAASRDYSNAISAYQKAINRKPGYALAYFNMGISETQTGNLDKAIKWFSTALKIDPSLTEAYRNLGVAYYMVNQYKQSLFYFEKYLQYCKDESIRVSILRDIEQLKKLIGTQK